MRTAVTVYETLMRARPDYGKESTEYAVGLTETLSYLTDEELAWIANPREGLATVCKFLPTAADVHDFLRAKRAKEAEYKPAHTAYRRLNEDSGPWEKETDYERKARVVRELLGYNPSAKAQQLEPKRELVPPTAEDLRNLKLKTPPGPISRQLREKLEAEGWQFVPPEEKTA
jgi:hypothetical protein